MLETTRNEPEWMCSVDIASFERYETREMDEERGQI